MFVVYVDQTLIQEFGSELDAEQYRDQWSQQYGSRIYVVEV